ncbi:hypothetical protein EMIT07CA2_10211 [Brevibacillus sp. IT-7CA2]
MSKFHNDNYSINDIYQNKLQVIVGDKGAKGYKEVYD